MNCLNCGKEMMSVTVQMRHKQIAYDTCEACGSFWLDKGELDKMAYGEKGSFGKEGSFELSSTVKAERVSESKRKCPRCNIGMDKVFFLEYTDILLDRCSNCGGFWFDGGELDLVSKEVQSLFPDQTQGFMGFVNNVHLPYWYKRVVKRSSETDFKIDAPPIQNAKMKAPTSLVCPTCKKNLDTYTAYGIKFDACPVCKGLWLTLQELHGLKDKAEKGSWETLRWLNDEVDAIEKANAMPSTRACPKCKSVELVSTNFGNSKILVDWCPTCHGLWLDQGEFQDIVDFLKSELINMPAKEAEQKAFQDIKEVLHGRGHKVSELLDARAAIWAFIDLSIFEHPALAERMIGLQQVSRRVPGE